MQLPQPVDRAQLRVMPVELCELPRLLQLCGRLRQLPWLPPDMHGVCELLEPRHGGHRERQHRLQLHLPQRLDRRIVRHVSRRLRSVRRLWLLCVRLRRVPDLQAHLHQRG